jgi:hypothetical protein
MPYKLAAQNIESLSFAYQILCTTCSNTARQSMPHIANFVSQNHSQRG